ncbi:MAG: histidine phosphotransferase family protein [Hellea sp.]
MTKSRKNLLATDLASLISSRICHDLISPIGALNTAIEVLDDTESKEMHEDALKLIKLSASEASAKLSYLRIALGTNSTSKDVMNLDKLKLITENMFNTEKFSFNWDVSEIKLEKSIARILLNILMLARQSIPRGGKVTIKIEEKSDKLKLVTSANGIKSRLDKQTEDAFKGIIPSEEIDGRVIQSFFTGVLIDDLNGRIEAFKTDGNVIFNVTIPVDNLK